ncbi:MAG TPA: hypothetical protein VJU79_05730 [Candidatus Dormibacteraeota bacterium]|nr:hypothetical protein [Candidatus Dormibacteraeota bacterium]
MSTQTAGEIDTAIAAANPLSAHDAQLWAVSAAANRVRQRALQSEPLTLSRWGTHRALVASGLAVLGLMFAAGVAVAAVHVLGGPAPARVQHDLGSVDQGMPADLRYRPDVHNARLVADASGSQLYAADLRDGGYCSELVVRGRAAGAVCVSNAVLRVHPIQVTVPLPDSARGAPVVLGGRVTVAHAAQIQAAYADGGRDLAPLMGGYYVLSVSASHRASALASAFTLAAVDAAGRTLASVQIPAAGDETPPPAPIDATTISDASDFTLVLGVEGTVNAAGATSLTLQLPDGSDLAVPLHADHTFRLDLPPALQRAFATRPGELIARDAAGRVVGTTMIESVAAARAAEQSGLPG